MKTIVRSTIVLFTLVILLCGVYPLFITLLGNLFFYDKAQGSFIKKNGKVVGSKLIGQNFSYPYYFQGRPSAAGNGYDAANSSGSNLAPTSKKLRDRMRSEITRLQKENPDAKGLIPTELLTASGSGLDPHISPAAAEFQIPRIAASRGISEKDLREVLVQFVESPEFGFLGESRINVLLVNLELDNQFPVRADARTSASLKKGRLPRCVTLDFP